MNTFQIPYPDKLAAGCCVFLAINYDATKTISTISDTINGSWSTTPVRSVTGANAVLSLFRFPNSGAANPDTGTPLVVTVVFTTTIQIPQTWLLAFSGIAATSPENGGSSAASQVSSGGAVNAGSFTPTAGDLVLAFFAVDGLNFADGSPTSISASAGFTLMSADIGWVNAGNGLPKASSYLIGSSGAVNPGITPTGNNSSDTWNCIAEAFKVGASGSPPSGAYVASYSFFFVSTQPANWKLQAPRLGRHVISTPGEFDSITDSDGNTFNYVPNDGSPPVSVSGQIWKVGSSGVTGPNPSLELTLSLTGGSGNQVHCAVYDLIGVSGNIGANQWQTTPTQSGNNCPDNPDITPTTTNAIMILSAPDGTGPVTQISNPSTAVLDDMVMGTGNNDSNTENSGDGWGHFRVLSSMVGVSQDVTWQVNSAGGATAPTAHAAEFILT